MENKVEPIITISKDYVKEFESTQISDSDFGRSIPSFSFLCNYVDLGPFPLNNEELAKRCKAKYVVDEYKKTGLYSYNVGNCLAQRLSNGHEEAKATYLCQVVDRHSNVEKSHPCILILSALDFPMGPMGKHTIQEHQKKFMFIPSVMQQIFDKKMLKCQNREYMQSAHVGIHITYDQLIEMFVIIFDALFKEHDLLNPSEIYASIKAVNLSRSIDLMKSNVELTTNLQTYKTKLQISTSKKFDCMAERDAFRVEMERLKMALNTAITTIENRDREILELKEELNSSAELLKEKDQEIDELTEKLNYEPSEEDPEESEKDPEESEESTNVTTTDKDLEIYKLKGELYDLSKKLKDVEDKHNGLAKEHANLVKSNRETKDQLIMANNKVTSRLMRDLEIAMQKCDDSQKRHDILQKEYDEFRQLSKIDTDKLKRDIETSNKHCMDFKSSQPALSECILSLTKQLDDTKTRFTNLTESYDRSIVRIRDLETINNSKSTAISQLQNDRSKLQTDKEMLSLEISEVTRKNRILEVSLNQKQKSEETANNLSDRIDYLENKLDKATVENIHLSLESKTLKILNETKDKDIKSLKNDFSQVQINNDKLQTEIDGYKKLLTCIDSQLFLEDK